MLKIWFPKSSAEEAMQRSSHQDAKKQPSRCKEATVKMQRSNHQDAKLYLSECKVITIKMQFQIFSVSI